MVTISTDEPEQEQAARKFLDRSGVTGPGYWRQAADDDRFINRIGRNWSGALPALFLYDRQGHRAASFIGGESGAMMPNGVPG